MKEDERAHILFPYCYNQNFWVGWEPKVFQLPLRHFNLYCVLRWGRDVFKRSLDSPPPGSRPRQPGTWTRRGGGSPGSQRLWLGPDSGRAKGSGLPKEESSRVGSVVAGVSLWCVAKDKNTRQGVPVLTPSRSGCGASP